MLVGRDTRLLPREPSRRRHARPELPDWRRGRGASSTATLISTTRGSSATPTSASGSTSAPSPSTATCGTTTARSTSPSLATPSRPGRRRSAVPSSATTRGRDSEHAQHRHGRRRHVQVCPPGCCCRSASRVHRHSVRPRRARIHVEQLFETASTSAQRGAVRGQSFTAAEQESIASSSSGRVGSALLRGSFARARSGRSRVPLRVLIGVPGRRLRATPYLLPARNEPGGLGAWGRARTQDRGVIGRAG